jgi:hypothetical protein
VHYRQEVQNPEQINKVQILPVHRPVHVQWFDFFVLILVLRPLLYLPKLFIVNWGSENDYLKEHNVFLDTIASFCWSVWNVTQKTNEHSETWNGAHKCKGWGRSSCPWQHALRIEVRSPIQSGNFGLMENFTCAQHGLRTIRVHIQFKSSTEDHLVDCCFFMISMQIFGESSTLAWLKLKRKCSKFIIIIPQLRHIFAGICFHNWGLFFRRILHPLLFVCLGGEWIGD